jgi:hypothetical protein
MLCGIALSPVRREGWRALASRHHNDGSRRGFGNIHGDRGMMWQSPECRHGMAGCHGDRMHDKDSFRRRLIGAIASGALLAGGCGGRARDGETSPPTPFQMSVNDAGATAQDASAPDAATSPARACTPGRESQQCYTRAEMEAVIRSGGGQIQRQPPPTDQEVAAAFLANGCARKSLVFDGCCNPALTDGIPTGDRCCYTHCMEACCGRPLWVNGAARVAPPALRNDWHARPFGSALLGPAPPEAALRSRLAAAYLKDALLEHASIASFTRFTLELLAIAAPAELVLESQRAAADEVEHARLCFAMAASFAAVDLGPGALDLNGLDSRTTLHEITAAVVREGCLGETISAAVASEQASLAADPALRAALQRIAADEQRHAELAWRFVAWALATGGESARRTVERTFAEELASQGETAAAEPCSANDLLLWHRAGRLSAAETLALAATVRREVITPALHALLAPDNAPEALAAASKTDPLSPTPS